MKGLALLPFFFAAPAWADQDYWGNEYPPECSVEALAQVYVPEVRVTQSFLDKATRVPDSVGVFMPTGVMAIRADLDGDLLEDTRRHEKCHKVAGNWHG